ncbi:AcrR family transcriptional regulator [Caballeronia udeis]|uniref:AcrR family transcriptional regulator n=2 Tax=Caballeronia udeis TaxID=1232866 RepID=A0ABW8MUL1_9BURK
MSICFGYEYRQPRPQTNRGLGIIPLRCFVPPSTITLLLQEKNHPDMPARKTEKTRRPQGRPSTSGAVGKEAILAATRETLKTVPPGEITFQQVALLAGIDKRLIRYYFGQMPDLLKVVAIEITEELRNRFVASNVRDGSIRDRLRLRISIFLDFFGSNPHFHRLVVDYLLNTTGPERDAALDRFRHSIGELQVLLSGEKASGQAYPLDARFVHVSMAAICEFMFSAKPVFTALFGNEVDTPAFKDRFCDFVTDLVMGSAAIGAAASDIPEKPLTAVRTARKK